jgi:hypothetical protein
MQEINVKEETFGISSSSISREDHEARHKSRHLMNMTPNGPKSPWNWTEDAEACGTRSSV